VPGVASQIVYEPKQFPPEHVPLLLHAELQAPQLAGSVIKPLQPFVQAVCVGFAHIQFVVVPEVMQLLPAGQVFPQDPQLLLLLLVSVQTPPQSVRPPMHWQLPEMQP
jgi:hypothetical protein